MTLRKADEEVAESKRMDELLLLLEKAINTTTTGITFSDLDGKVRFTNPSEARMHGYTVDELIGKDASILAPPDDRSPLTIEDLKKMKNWARERINIRKDGSRFPVHLVSDVLMNNDGEPIGVITISEDITKRKKAEEATLEAERHAAKGVLAAEIAHDINNSLAGIQTSLFIANRLPKNNQYRGNIFEDINKELKKIADVVKGICDLYEPDASDLKLVDLNTEVKKTIELTQRRLKGKGISVTVKIMHGLHPVMCYSGNVRQILLNLIKNAEDAMVLAEKKAITINTREEDGFVKVEVKDTGCGINKEKLDNVFSIAYPADEKLGFGLPVCRVIARKYGGDIMVQSEEGRGTTVTLAIPKGEHG
jgi:PAS domain S-box-containing protein